MEQITMELSMVLQEMTPKLEQLFDDLLECAEGTAENLIELATSFGQELLENAANELQGFFKNVIELLEESGVLEGLVQLIEGLNAIVEAIEAGIEAFQELPTHEQVRLIAVAISIVACPDLLLAQPELLRPLQLEVKSTPQS